MRNVEFRAEKALKFKPQHLGGGHKERVYGYFLIVEARPIVTAANRILLT
jgi:hypothetical protein